MSAFSNLPLSSNESYAVPENDQQLIRLRDSIPENAPRIRRIFLALSMYSLWPKEIHMTIKIIPNDKGNPPGKLADAELHFTSGPLEGLKLIGFGIWERRTGNGRNVTLATIHPR